MSLQCAPCLSDLALVREAVTSVGGTSTCTAHAVLLRHPSDDPGRRRRRLSDLRTLAEQRVVDATGTEKERLELLVQEYAVAEAMDLGAPDRTGPGRGNERPGRRGRDGRERRPGEPREGRDPREPREPREGREGRPPRPDRGPRRDGAEGAAAGAAAGGAEAVTPDAAGSPAVPAAGSSPGDIALTPPASAPEAAPAPEASPAAEAAPAPEARPAPDASPAPDAAPAAEASPAPEAARDDSAFGTPDPS